MKPMNLITAALLAFTTVACTADETEATQSHVSYDGLFDEIALDVGADDISEGFVIKDLKLSGGGSVSASIERLGEGTLEPGSYTIQLAPDSLLRLDDNRAPIPTTAAEASLVLNDRHAEPVCGVYSLTATALVTTSAGEAFPVAVSLAATSAVRQYLATAIAVDPGSMKGCKTIVEPKESCGGACTISLGLIEFSGMCDGFGVTIPWYVQGQWVYVPMKACFCNTTK